MPKGIKADVVEHGIPEQARVCDACGAFMKPVGKEFVRALVLHPATATIREDVYYIFARPKCKTDAKNTPILKTDRIPVVIPSSYS